jgi:protein-L-isoaspartate O-methyltransferase
MIEYVSELADRARTLLAGMENVSVLTRDAHDTAAWSGARKVHCGFCIAALPPSWADALSDGGMLVAPVGDAHRQVLTVFEKREGVVMAHAVGPVLYVGDRSRSGAPSGAAGLGLT